MDSNRLNDVSFDRPFRIGLFRTCGRLGHHVPAYASNPAIMRVFLFLLLLHTGNKGKIQGQVPKTAEFFRYVVLDARLAGSRYRPPQPILKAVIGEISANGEKVRTPTFQSAKMLQDARMSAMTGRTAAS